MINIFKSGSFSGLFSGFLWGVNGVLLSLILSESFFSTRPEQSLIISLVVAALNDCFSFLWISSYTLVQKKFTDLFLLLKTNEGKMVCLGALCGGPLSMTAYLLAIHKVGPIYTLVITANYPAVGAVLASLLLGEKMTSQIKKGLCFSILGSILVGISSLSVGGFSLVPTSWWVLLAFVPVFGWALEGVIITKATRTTVKEDDGGGSLLALHLRQCASSFFYLVIFIPLFHATPLLLDLIPTKVSLHLSLVSLVGVISYFFWYNAMKLVGVGKGMALNMTYALWVVLLDYHSFSWILLFGAGFIVLGASTIVMPGLKTPSQKFQENVILSKLS